MNQFRLPRTAASPLDSGKYLNKGSSHHAKFQYFRLLLTKVLDGLKGQSHLTSHSPPSQGGAALFWRINTEDSCVGFPVCWFQNPLPTSCSILNWKRTTNEGILFSLQSEFAKWTKLITQMIHLTSVHSRAI